MLPWSVNTLAQAAVSYLMTRNVEIDNFIEKTREFIKTERKNLAGKLVDTGKIKVFPSTTVFLLAKLPDNLTSDKVCEDLKQEKILLRNCSNFKGLSGQFIRISLKKSEINKMVAEKLTDIIASSQ